jgi:hypothetical protein
MTGWIVAATLVGSHGLDLRVYVADGDRKLVDPGDLGIVVHLERPEAKRKTLELELATPRGSKRFGLGHGGQIVKADGYFVELVLFDSHKDLADEEDGTPYFRTDVGIVEPPGFQATVEFRIKGKTRVAEGFEHPLVPESFKDALRKLENRLSRLRTPAAANDAEAVFLAQSVNVLLWKSMLDLAGLDAREAVKKILKDASALAQELEAAVRAADAKRASVALDRYDVVLAELKKLVK